MNVDLILETLNRNGVKYLLIGGVNFLLRHRPVLTFDVDIWIEDMDENLSRCEQALGELEAQWGCTDADWGPVKTRAGGWLSRQPVYCLTSVAGAIDVFRSVKGLGAWKEAWARGTEVRTAGGIACKGLSDEDMLACQLALDEPDRKLDRIRELQAALRKEGP